MAYGLLTYDKVSNNLGDEVQSIAARAFLPQVDCYVQREELKEFSHAEPTKVILNGWYMHNPEQWPPSHDLEPLITSFHIQQSNPKVVQLLLSGEGEAFFRSYGKPVGARDLATLELFQTARIPAYFSGCLTLTLQRNPQIIPAQYICAVDISPQLLDWIGRKTQRPIYHLTNEIPADLPFQLKMRLAQTQLEILQGAHCVITGRLHAAMPCLAYETPVLLIDGAKDQERFAGLNLLVRHCSEETLVRGDMDFDFDQPTSNSSEYVQYRTKLITQCNEFVGTDIHGQRKTFMPDTPEDKALLMQELWQWRKEEKKAQSRNKWTRIIFK